MDFMGKGVFSLPAKDIWQWNVFGGEPVLLQGNIPWEVPLWRRLLTKVLLGSKWVRLDDN